MGARREKAGEELRGYVDAGSHLQANGFFQRGL